MVALDPPNVSTSCRCDEPSARCAPCRSTPTPSLPPATSASASATSAYRRRRPAPLDGRRPGAARCTARSSMDCSHASAQMRRSAAWTRARPWSSRVRKQSRTAGSGSTAGGRASRGRGRDHPSGHRLGRPFDRGHGVRAATHAVAVARDGGDGGRAQVDSPTGADERAGVVGTGWAWCPAPPGRR